MSNTAIVPARGHNTTLAARNHSDDLDVFALAEAMAKSGYFADARDANKALVKILFGREYGLGPAQSMTSIHVIEGKPSVGADVMAARIKANPKYDYKVIETTDEVCTLEFFEDGESSGRLSLTLKEAQEKKLNQRWDRESGQWKVKHNWATFPSDMLFARVISRGRRRFCPDAFDVPAYVHDELDADYEGEYTEGEVTQVEPVAGTTKVRSKKAATPPPAEPTPPAPSGPAPVVFPNGPKKGLRPDQVSTKYNESVLKFSETNPVPEELIAEIVRVEAERVEAAKTATQVEAPPEPEPETAPPPESTSPAKKGLPKWMIAVASAAEKAGLSMKPEHRVYRIAATNKWLFDRGNRDRSNQGPLVISSWNDIPQGIAYPMVQAIETGELRWGTSEVPAPVVADLPDDEDEGNRVVEGEVTENGSGA